MPQHLNWFYIGAIILFAFLTVLFPVKQNGEAVLSVVWITVPAFLLYGLLTEIIVMQIALLAKVIYNRKEENWMAHFLIRSMLFFVLSFVSAAAFHFAGGRIGNMNFWSLVFSVAVYQLVHRGVYSFAKQLYANRQVMRVHFARAVLLDSLFILLILPFTLTLYYLVQYIGFGAFLLLGIPFFFIVIILRLHNNNEKINRNLQRVGAIGHQLSNNLTEEKVIDQFVENVSDLIRADMTYLYDNHKGWLELIRVWDNEALQKVTTNHLQANCLLASSVLADNQPVIFDERNEWVDLVDGHAYEQMQSALVIPILRNEKVEGVLLAFAMRKRAFEEYQLQIADIFCSYFTVTVEKARNVEETVKKSERCGLTKLYNYLYLEERLEFEQKRLDHNRIESLTVVMLDIDYFKKVNDTYGHQSGNDVLMELARILDQKTPENGVVGRYGGEEFVFILPEMTKRKALVFVEKLRLIIEAHRFQITPDLDGANKSIDISITASIGLSSIPEDTDEAKTLIRNADRALYLGAKRSGRNRVAGYVK